MLVLTRKLDEQILIGDDIKITLLRVRGNSVRIGIEAPRSTRIVRGELFPKADESATIKQEIDVELDGPIDDLAEVFAHPESQTIVRETKSRPTAKPTNRIEGTSEVSKAELFVGTVKKSGKNPKLIPAPLAAFVSAS